MIKTTSHKTLTTLIILLSSLAITAASGADPDQGFSHQLFDNALRQNVDSGYVDYPAIANSPDYENYINALAETTDFRNSNDELSYWINAYNALAIKGILDGRSPSTFFGKIGYFYNAEYTVNGITTNLYDLEHELIIPLGEPRIHFVLNCASASCPLLSSETYQAEKLEQQLEIAATRFINDDSRNRFDMKTKTAYLSKIYDWFSDDFISHSGSVQNYLALYIQDEKISNTLANNEFTIEFLEYDWSLNGKPPEPE
jgi:hypothetical protein